MSAECGACKFWLKRSDAAGERGGGMCRRYPPHMASGVVATMSRPNLAEFEIRPASDFMNDAWPMVHQQSWCGEFAPS